MAQEYIVTQPGGQSQISRRSRMETFGDILRVIGSGASKPTHIMYKANLSWIVMQEYMKTLESQALVLTSDEKSKRQYHLSQKGFELLNKMKTIREDLNLST
ncbi:MAG: winged helix-turn-helix domain-containing protein, partial [Nitrososphaerales archaeon]